MNIEEHNENALAEALQLGIDHGIVAENAELKAIDTNYPRCQDVYDKPGRASGYLKILSDEEDRIHWILVTSFHEDLGETIWRSNGLNALEPDKQDARVNELKKIKEQRINEKAIQLVENRTELARYLKSLPVVAQHPYLLRKKFQVMTF